MAFIPVKMDESQMAFLANEITKTYMNGKNMMNQAEFAREYLNMYRNTLKMIAEEQSKQNSAEQNLQELQDLLDEEPLDLSDARASSMFR